MSAVTILKIHNKLTIRTHFIKITNDSPDKNALWKKVYLRRNGLGWMIDLDFPYVIVCWLEQLTPLILPSKNTKAEQGNQRQNSYMCGFEVMQNCIQKNWITLKKQTGIKSYFYEKLVICVMQCNHHMQMVQQRLGGSTA